MKIEKQKIFLLAGGIILLAALLFFLLDFYPAALVNGKIIGVAEFNRSVAIAGRFFAAQVKIAGENPEVLSAGATETELKRAALEGLIAERLVESELKKRIGQTDLDEMVANRLATVSLETENMEKGTQLLYGLSVEELKNFILTPQVKYEILEGNFISREENFKSWLEKAKKEARVSVFVPGFLWKDGALQVAGGN